MSDINSNSPIVKIREQLTKLIKSDSTSTYDHRDLDLINQDWYVSMFVGNGKKSTESIVNQLDKCLKWRKSFGIRDISFVSIPRVIYRQIINEFYQIGDNWYTVTNWRNVHIPSGFSDVNFKYTAALLDFIQYKRGQNITLNVIHDFSGVGVSNINIDFLTKVSFDHV